MSTFPTPILDTVLLVLIPLFLPVTRGDVGMAREAATGVLNDYKAATQEELRLAGEIVTYSLNALQALAESADPDIPISRVIRLRGNAVSLRRVAGQAQRKLDQLQRARLAGTPLTEQAAATADPAPSEPAETPAPAPEAQAGGTQPVPTPMSAKPTATLPPRHWSQADRKRAMAMQMAETSRRKKAEYEQQQAQRAAATTPPPLQAAL